MSVNLLLIFQLILTILSYKHYKRNRVRKKIVLLGTERKGNRCFATKTSQYLWQQKNQKPQI